VKGAYARARNSRPLDTDLSLASLKKKMTQKILSSKLRTKGSQADIYLKQILKAPTAKIRPTE
jgi:hypothetical protein